MIHYGAPHTAASLKMKPWKFNQWFSYNVTTWAHGVKVTLSPGAACKFISEDGKLTNDLQIRSDI